MDKKILTEIDNIKKRNYILKKTYNKTYKVLLKRLSQYIIYKNKFIKQKEKYKQNNFKKYKKLTSKNKQIKQLNNIRTFLRSFIVHVKSYIPKDLYRQYLDNYKIVKQGKKIRF